jgi:hypothetical protein
MRQTDRVERRKIHPLFLKKLDAIAFNSMDTDAQWTAIF